MLKRSQVTAVSMALLAFGIAGCLAFALLGESLARVIQYDVFKLLAQLFVVTVLGASATMVYADLSRAREKREQRREILRETLRQLIEVYNECKRVRRLLRANAICLDEERRKCVRRDRYDPLLERLNDAQLHLEFYKRYVKWNADLFKEAVGVAEHLSAAEKYLNHVVSEWEDLTQACSSDQPTLDLERLTHLKEFIDKARKGFGPCVAHPVEMALRSLAHAISPTNKRKENKTMTHVLIRHKIADFAKWKPVYDAHSPARQAAGLREEHLLRGIDDPNEVVLLFAGDDLKKAQAFAASPDLREVMQKAGVIGKPDISFLLSGPITAANADRCGQCDPNSRARGRFQRVVSSFLHPRRTYR